MATAKSGYPFPNIIAFKTANRNKNTRYSEEYLVFILCLLNTIDAIVLSCFHRKQIQE